MTKTRLKAKAAQQKQYDKFAREFKEADENFPDVTRNDLHKLAQSIFYHTAFRFKLGHDPQKFPKLLDLGCGYGRDLEYFSKGEIEVYGIDESAEMLKLAKRRVPGAKLKRADFAHLPFPGDYFDMVFSRYAIQHVGDTDKVFREMHRVLKPHGKLVFLVTHPIRHFLEKETKDYWKQENIHSVILNEKLTVEEPSHTLSEYMSPFLLSYFDLQVLLEIDDPAAKRFEGFGEYPRALLLKYNKRSEPVISPYLE